LKYYNKNYQNLFNKTCSENNKKEEKMNLTKEKMLDMLETMLLIREFETPLENMLFEQKTPGDIHQCIGEEASAVGVCFALEKKDYVFSNHRGHGHCIAKGLEPKFIMAELEGKVTGYSKGRGGSMHIMDIKNGLMGTSGIVAGSVPLANGPALKAKLKGTDEVSVVFFGDGGSNQGSVHESMNLASIWKLPTIFVLENNHYAECTAAEYSCSIKDFTKRALSYDMQAFQADGSDVVDVYNKASEAVKHARSGQGPSLLVIDLYRYKGHYIGEPEGYRTKEEIEEYMTQKDPIKNFKNSLIKKGFITENDYDKMLEKVKSIITDAIKFADESPWPDKSETYRDVYV